MAIQIRTQPPLLRYRSYIEYEVTLVVFLEASWQPRLGQVSMNQSLNFEALILPTYYEALFLETKYAKSRGTVFI